MRDGRHYSHYIIIGIIFAAVYLLQSGLGLLPGIFSVEPLPLLALITAIAMFESKTAAFAFGLCGGLLMDVLSHRISCFNTVYLTVAAVGVALLIELLFNNAPLTAAVLGGIVCAGYYVVYWFVYLIQSGDAMMLLLCHGLLGAVYSWAFTMPFYFLMRALQKRERRIRV